MEQPRTVRDVGLAAGGVVTTMSHEFVVATYDIETSLPLEHAAEVLAGEQSTGTFVRVERETDDLRARFAAQIEGIEELPPSGASPLPGFVGDPAARRRARLRLRFPLDNFGPSVPNLQAAVAGNLFELKEFAALKLVDLDLPLAFAERYPGPAFGVAGTRRLVGRPEGAMIGTIVKPSIGLSPAQLAELVGELAEAGIDFIKDDELQGNGPSAPLAERVAAVMPVLERYADRTGRKPMYAFNITDDIGRLEANHDLVVAAGGTCVMVCVTMVGLAGVEYLRRHAEVPIHGHRAMFGAISRSEQVGIGFRAWQKLARLCGVDHLHTNGISNKFYETDDQVLDSIRAVREPLLGLTSTVPVLSSGQWGGLAHATFAEVGTTDLLVLAGGGIHGHPDGAGAGVASMRAAWESAERGERVQDALERSPELRRARSDSGPSVSRLRVRLLRRRLHRKRRRPAAVRPARLDGAPVRGTPLPRRARARCGGRRRHRRRGDRARSCRRMPSTPRCGPSSRPSHASTPTSCSTRRARRPIRRPRSGASAASSRSGRETVPSAAAVPSCSLSRTSAATRCSGTISPRRAVPSTVSTGSRRWPITRRRP